MSKPQDAALAKLAPGQQVPAIAPRRPPARSRSPTSNFNDADARQFRDGMTVVVNNGTGSPTEGPFREDQSARRRPR